MRLGNYLSFEDREPQVFPDIADHPRIFVLGSRDKVKQSLAV